LTGKKIIKIGDRVELMNTTDSWTKIEKGSKGTVVKIEEDQELIWINWDNGEKIALIDGIDIFKFVKK
jgi:small-conductance mechanosensitive channel